MSHSNQTKYKDKEKLWLPLMFSCTFVLCIGYNETRNSYSDSSEYPVL